MSISGVKRKIEKLATGRKTYTATMRKDLHERLKKMAARDGISVSMLIETLVEAYLEENEKERR